MPKIGLCPPNPFEFGGITLHWSDMTGPLLIKNSGRVTAMKGRELLEKGHIYHLYYHEKVTFIFDQEDTEIEVHYKDLKPNER